MKRLSVLLLGLFLLLSGVHASRAVTTIARDFDQLVTRADSVFKGSVTGKTSQWTGEGTTRHIVTFVTFKVEETYKGVATPEQTLRFLGGTVGDDTMAVPDMPQFEIGQKAVLFVVGNGKQFCPLVGVAQGRFHVVKDVATDHERVFTNDFLPVVNTKEIGQFDGKGVPLLERYTRVVDAQAMAAEDFRGEILAKVAALSH